ncbi:hypothetical protein GB937_005698 [Aspergillus fischeri]|nr:hypothetical protein GB937_005698 [Aspergillus fischeri]
MWVDPPFSAFARIRTPLDSVASTVVMLHGMNQAIFFGALLDIEKSYPISESDSEENPERCAETESGALPPRI